jgi:polyhydroxybutyrate depolymerase
MRLFVLTFICFFRLSFADSITVDNLERTYIVHLPKGFDKKTSLPLVIALHGGGGQGKGMLKLSGFNEISDKNNFVVVYPDGIKKQWNDGRDDFHLNRDINDVKFISCLIDSLIVFYNIDSNRIYVTGISNGGIMSFRLACELSDKIAAFAPVAASMPLDPAYVCRPTGSIPAMIIFGDADPLVPFEGGDISLPLIGTRGKVIPVNDAVAYWIKNNKCNTLPAEMSKNDADDGTELDKKIYSPANSQADVQFWLVKGGGHCWPGGAQYLPKSIIGISSKEFDASEEIWKFFSGKRKNRD